MDKVTLRKVQLTQLEILREIRRVCEENDIRFFLSDGTFLGAVRHKGFIPWDDDLDVGMLREDYDKFRRIAPQKLKPQYFFQDWYSDPNYAPPFGKVRKCGTVYQEAKSSPLQENGFFVDVFPYDYAPESPAGQQKLLKKTRHLFRIKLMKSHYTPWMEGDRVIWKKRIAYLWYQLLALFTTQEKLARTYDSLIRQYPESATVYGQCALSRLYSYPAEMMKTLGTYPFEDDSFPGPQDYDGYLTRLYGDYMTPPPEDERENRHQIIQLDFGPDDVPEGE